MLCLKVWADLKLRKKKSAQNKQLLQKTGGGPFTEFNMTTYEKSVEELLSIKTSSAPEGTAFGIAAKNHDVENTEPSTSSCKTPEYTNTHSPTTTNQHSTPKSSTLTRKRKHSTLTLLEEQVSNQKKLIQSVLTQNQILSDQNQILLDLVNVLKEKL